MNLSSTPAQAKTMAALHIAACSMNIFQVKKQVSADGPCPVPYVFLGKDFFHLRKWEHGLGSGFARIDIARLLDGVADEIKEDHVQWLDQVNRKYGQDPEWWFGTISSRHIYQSNLFQYSCYLETLRRLWEGSCPRPHLVLVESWGLAGAVMRWAGQNGIPIRLIGRPALAKEFLKKFVLGVLKWGNFSFNVLIRALAAHASGPKAQPKSASAGPLAILDTFVHESCWSPAGTYQERYFPGLLEFLRTQGFRVLIHPVLHGFRIANYFPFYRRMRQGKENFIILEDFLTLSDYLVALTFPWRTCRRKITAAPFRGFDLQDILWEEKIAMGNTSSLMAVLIYRLFLRLGATAWRPRIIINWYENQVIDRALIAGARRAFPDAIIIGAQIFVRLGHLIHLSPSPAEAEAGLAPHLFLTTSAPQCRAMQAFTQEIPCLPAAALRYAHIFQDYSPKDDKGPDRPTILVLLPFFLEDAVELLSIVKSALEHFPGEVPIWIKCHPDYGPAELIRLVGPKRWPERFMIFQGAMPEALGRASIVISSASGTAVEALARGLPVLLVSKQTALTPKLTGAEGISILKECFSATELATALQQVFHQQEAKITRDGEEGQKIRELFFTPVTPQTLMPYLGMGAKRG